MRWFQGLGEDYCAKNKIVYTLVNFLSGSAKLADMQDLGSELSLCRFLSDDGQYADLQSHLGYGSGGGMGWGAMLCASVRGGWRANVNF